MRNASAKVGFMIELPRLRLASEPQTQTSLWNRESWNELLAQVSALEKTAREKAEYCSGLTAPPENVDQARDEAWMRLAEIFVMLTGKKPSASPRFSRNHNQSKYADGYGGFVEAFMGAIGETVGDDEIPNFLRTERYRERMQKFLGAHHGLLREP
jgi:hypothetical protein